MDIYRRVSELVEDYKGKLTDQQIFTSPAYKSFINRKTSNIITGAFYTLRKEGFNASEYEEQRMLNSLTTDVEFIPGGDTAHTSVFILGDKRIWINADCDLVALQTEREYKHCAILGLLYHEIGHLLFTDFPTSSAWLNQLKSGVWFPEEPANAKTVNGINLVAKMKDPVFRKLIVKCAQHIENAIEDGFIEREMKEMYPVRGAECINTMNSVMEDNAKTLEQCAMDEKVSDFSALFQQILYYAVFENTFIGNYDGDLLDPLYEIIDIMDRYCYERDPLQRVRAVNEILCCLFPYLEKDIEDKKNEMQQKNSQKNSGQGNGQGSAQQGSGQGNGQQNNGQGSCQQGSSQDNSQQDADSNGLSQAIASAITYMMNQAADAMNVTDAGKYGNQSRAVNNPARPMNGDVPKRQKDGKDGNGQSGTAGSGNESQSGPGAKSGESNMNAMRQEMNGLVQQIANARANQAAEQERTEELNRENSTVDGSNYSLSNVSADVTRAADVEESNVAAYDEAMKELGPISRDLQRGIARVLKERREGGKRKNLPFGRRLEVSSIVHNDGKYFSRNKLPTESPKLGVALLVDESGSTIGDLIKAATRASLVIEDFCRELDIPHIISGYTTGGASVNIISYAEPGTVDGNDKYRITGMQARGGTPTKAGLLYMLQRLRKMPVDVRLLIVITDGKSGDNADKKAPYTTNPEGKPIRRIVREAKKEGTIIVAAGIGSDRNEVCSEFGAENFMDITNLDDMPEQLIGLIKDNIWV